VEFGHISKVFLIQRPEPSIHGDSSCRDRKVQFPPAAAWDCPVQPGRCCRLFRSEVEGAVPRKECFLSQQLRRCTRAAQPLVKNEGAQHDPLALLYRSPHGRSRSLWSCQAVDQQRRVEEYHWRSTGVRRPPLRRAFRTASNSRSTSSTGRSGICAKTSSNTASMRSRSSSLSLPTRAAYSCTASLTIWLLEMPSRAAVRSIRATVCSSKVNVTFVDAISIPYYHIYGIARPHTKACAGSGNSYRATILWISRLASACRGSTSCPARISSMLCCARDAKGFSPCSAHVSYVARSNNDGYQRSL